MAASDKRSGVLAAFPVARDAARAEKVGRHDLGRAVEDYKKAHGIPNNERLPYKKIREIAKRLKETNIITVIHEACSYHPHRGHSHRS